MMTNNKTKADPLTFCHILFGQKLFSHPSIFSPTNCSLLISLGNFKLGPWTWPSEMTQRTWKGSEQVRQAQQLNMDIFTTGLVPVVTAIISVSVFASRISVCFLYSPFFCAPPLTPRHLSAAKNKAVSAPPPPPNALSPLNAESTMDQSISANGMVLRLFNFSDRVLQLVSLALEGLERSPQSTVFTVITLCPNAQLLLVHHTDR